MSIIDILWKTLILLCCSIIKVFAVLAEGFAKLFGKIGELLEKLHDQLLNQVDRKIGKKSRIDVTL